MGRKKYTSENIFEISSYRNILHLIAMSNNVDKEILRSHLRVALCKNHDLKVSEDIIKELKDFFNLTDKSMFSEKLQNHKDFSFYVKNMLDQMVQSGWLNSDTKFKNSNVLNDALNRLKNDLKLIDTKKTKYGYNSYILTDKGHVFHARYLLKNSFNDLPQDELLLHVIGDLTSSISLFYYKKISGEKLLHHGNNILNSLIDLYEKK